MLIKSANLGEALNGWLEEVPPFDDMPADLIEDSAAASADFMLCALISRILPADEAPGPDPGVESPDPAGSPLWWAGTRHRAEVAAAANLRAGITADFDSVNYLAGGHLSAFLAPALLGRTDVPLDETLRTQTLATEFAVRVGRVVKDRARTNGFHVTPLVGGVSCVYALAFAGGYSPDRIRWCLRLFLSTFRSDYGLLGSDGRLYQMGQAIRHAYAAVAEGGAHRRPDFRSAREWWRPLLTLGVPIDSPVDLPDRWISGDRPTTLKPIPCCAYFFAVLAVVADLRRRVPSGTVRELDVQIPGYILAAHRDSEDGAWLAPFDLAHNISVCWLLGRGSWTPVPELVIDDVRRMRGLVRLRVTADDRPVTVAAVLADGTAFEVAGTTARADTGADHRVVLQQKCDIVRRSTGPAWNTLSADGGPRQLLQHLLDRSEENVRDLMAGSYTLNGALQ